MPGTSSWSYTPTEWKKGDIVTSVKLNKLEQGVADGSLINENLVVHENQVGNDFVLDKTWKEIRDALNNGKFVIIVSLQGELSVHQSIIEQAEIYDIDSMYLVNDNSGNEYNTDSENGYPIAVTGGAAQ